MCSTTCCAPSAMSTPTTMIPTSPANSRQPCSGLGRWKCMLAGPQGATNLDQPLAIGGRHQDVQLPRHTKLFARDCRDDVVLEGGVLDRHAQARDIGRSQSVGIAVQDLDDAPILHLLPHEGTR